MYQHWNRRLAAINRWVLDIRKMRDGLIPAAPIDVPDVVCAVLTEITTTLEYECPHKKLGPKPESSGGVCG